MHTRFFFLSLLTFGLIGSIGFAQDLPEDEMLEEIEAELAEITEARKLAEQRLKDLDLKVDLLNRAKKTRIAILKLERQIEAAEESGDEAEAERLDEQLGPLELDAEELEIRFDLLQQKQEIRGPLAELRLEGLDELYKQGRKLLELNQKREELYEKLFKTYREGPESEEGPLEEESERLAEEFEIGMERFFLRIDLHWAREEGDEGAIEELEHELKEFDDSAAFMLRSDESPEPGLMPAIEVDESKVAAASHLSFSDSIVPLLKQHCSECHDSSSAAGDLDIESLVEKEPLVVARQDWLNIRQQVAIGSMPPADVEEKPSAVQRESIVAFLTHSIDRFDYATVHSPGWEPARRLTHSEYDNTIRDLFGVDLKPTKRFPVDMAATSGFDNSASSLFIHPLLMERYVDAAESIADTLLPAKPTTEAHQVTWTRIAGNRSAREAVIDFATRAFRRPLGQDESAQLLKHFDALKEAGESNADAVRAMIQVILVSPSFLIRSEASDDANPGEPFRVSDHELAVRLSYFLWASIPDARLLRHAADGSLHRPEILRSQVQRMIRDEKSLALGQNFAIQWLGLGNLDRLQRDQIENPWATDSLVQAMSDETAMFFHSLVAENAPIERLIDAQYTFLNQELAKHYDFRAPVGQQMQRVELPEGRGGILGQGAILAITSFPGRTSPVVRGNWILSTLLGTPPPPPPPNVSDFDDRIAENHRLSQRQKLELHRRNPNCYACHSQIDPLGFALEQYHWMGQRRKPKVDTRAKLPGGREIVGLSGLRDALIEERRDDLVQQLVRKMLSYALGRQLDYYDEHTVDQVIESLEADGGRFQPLVQAIVASEAFQMKQMPKEHP